MAVLVASVALLIVTVKAHDKVMTMQPQLQNAAKLRMASDPTMIWGLCVQLKDQIVGANTSDLALSVSCDNSSDLGSIPQGGYGPNPGGSNSLPLTIYALAELISGPAMAQCYPVQDMLDTASSRVFDNARAACDYVSSKQLVDDWDIFSRLGIEPAQYCNCTMWGELLKTLVRNNEVSMGYGSQCVEVGDIVGTGDNYIIRLKSQRPNKPFRIDFVLPKSALEELGSMYATMLPNSTEAWSIANKTPLYCPEDQGIRYAYVQNDKKESYSCTDGVDNSHWETYTSVYAQVKKTFNTTFLGIPGGYDDMYAIYTGLLGGLFGSAATLIGLVLIAIWRVMSPFAVQKRVDDEEQCRLLRTVHDHLVNGEANSSPTHMKNG